MQSVDSEVEVVRAACRRTLAQRGARIYLTWLTDRAGEWTEPWMWNEGVVDPASRRVHVRSFHSENSPLMTAFKEAERRHPWLAEFGGEAESSSMPLDMPTPEKVQIGMKIYWHRWDGWTDQGERAQATGGLWLLEATQALTNVSVGDEINVRGVPCRRYAGRVRSTDVAGRPGIELVTLDLPDDRWREMDVEVSIDDTGFVRRLAASPTVSSHRKPGLVLRLLARLEDAPSASFEEDRLLRTWVVLELWDFGCETTIEAPRQLVSADVPANRYAAALTGASDTVQLAWMLWKQRRAYKRRTRHDPTT